MVSDRVCRDDMIYKSRINKKRYNKNIDRGDEN